MARRKRPSQGARPNRSRRRRRLAIAAVAVVGVAVLLVFGRGVLAILARRMAARQMEMWAISAAQQWLARAAWLDPGSGELELMRAACYRRCGEQDRWAQAILSAEQKGVPAVRIRQEMQLAAIPSEQVFTRAETLSFELIEAGVSPQDVATALLYCYLAHKQYRKARVFLELWEPEFADDAHTAYLWGFYWMTLDDLERARAQFQLALAREPRHELARSTLAEISEMEDRLDQALEQHADSVSRFPGSTVAKVSLARVLRRLDRIDEARAALAPLTSGQEPPPDAVLEMAQLELESGNYPEADRWFAKADLERRSEELLPAAITSTLMGDPARAERLFAQYDAMVDTSQRVADLEIRLTINSSDRQAADELQRLLSQSNTTAKDMEARESPQAGKAPQEKPATAAAELYALQCGACHGPSGDGTGRAARYLFPRPRDLRTGRFRLVSTQSGAPTLEDLEAVTRQGMPGTSMPAFEDLSESQHTLLAREVLRLQREGIREQFIQMLKAEGEEIDENEVLEVVQQYADPGEVVKSPQIGPPDARAIAGGKDAYFNLGCDNCHGDDGVGAPDMPLFDDKWRPARARDLVHEPFKGGHEPETLYLRIFVGMPGSPHPACSNVSEQELIDLVQYCRSLSREPKPVLTNRQRDILGTGRAYLSALRGKR